MSLKLTLAEKSSPWNTVYQTDTGETLYRTENVASSSAIPSKVVIYGCKIRGGRSYQGFFATAPEEMNIASIWIRDFHDDQLTINGVTMKEKDLFTKVEGSGWYGRDRVWRGPDGQDYRWKMGLSKPELYRNDRHKTLVAKFHREHSGFMGLRDKTRASLEICGQVTEALLDMIIITFVYMETSRAGREHVTSQVVEAGAGA